MNGSISMFGWINDERKNKVPKINVAKSEIE